MDSQPARNVTGSTEPTQTDEIPPIEDETSGVENSGKTLGQLIEPYLKARRYELVKHSRQNARTWLHQADRFFGARPVRKIGRNDIDRFMAHIGHLAPASRRSALSTLRAFWRWAQQHGYTSRNPAAETRAPRQPRRLPRGLNVDKVTALLNAVPDDRGRLIVLLMVQQGLRCVEVSRLDVGDLDLQYGTLRVVGKGGHERVLPIVAELRTELDRQILPVAGPLIVSHKTGERLLAPTISRLVSGWCTEAGIKRCARDGVSAHALRHTTATDMLRAGAHLRDVQAALGHKSIATTEVYLPTHVQPLVEAMAGRSYAG